MGKEKVYRSEEGKSAVVQRRGDTLQAKSKPNNRLNGENKFNNLIKSKRLKSAVLFLFSHYKLTNNNFSLYIVERIERRPSAWMIVITQNGEKKPSLYVTKKFLIGGYEFSYLIRSLGHEAQHIDYHTTHIKSGKKGDGEEQEFLGYAWEALSSGVPQHTKKRRKYAAERAMSEIFFRDDLKKKYQNKVNRLEKIIND
ncbi:MAG: hypothetical protein ACI8ZM_000489 [Crocinitomix sp.]|jgi:hypothetical protein